MLRDIGGLPITGLRNVVAVNALGSAAEEAVFELVYVAQCLVTDRAIS